MSYSITQANADLSSVLHGTNLNKVSGLTNLHNRTARQLLSDLDPQETIRKTLTTTPLFDQVWDYACPSDLKSNRIIDISPQYIRNPSQITGQQYNQDFDISKNLVSPPSSFTIQWNNQVKTIRINDTWLPQGTVLDTMESADGWAAYNTNVTNIIEDNVNYASGSGSLKFNIIAGGGTIEGRILKTLSSALDLTSHLNQSSLFMYAYFPVGSNISSVKLHWGSDVSNYYTSTVSVTNEGTAFATGWNLLRFDWSTSATAGSPDVTAIDFVQISVYTNGTASIVRLDNLVSVMGLYRTVEYYSKFLFRDSSTGAFQETVTDNSNLVNLDTDSYNLYLNLLAFYATQQIQGLSAMFFDDNFFGQEYLKGKLRYTSLNKSQVQKPREQYYSPQKGGYSKFMGRRWNP